ncbi:MAG: SPOR domain-containing protein [Gammaproteobacteria bacterium]|nr:SPOR domain-containing protein [Gammaproteobacteria bacterium]
MAPRDYKQRPRQAPRKTVRKRSPWLYFAAGMLTGSAATVVVYFNEFIPTPLYISPRKAPAEQKSVEEKPKARSEQPESSKPRFEFYTLLPEMEVAVPEAELKPGQQTMGNTPTGPGTYYLQAGSFRLPEEADRMKANLAFLGLESSIQTVSINGADTWHRVRIGPFSDLVSLNEARRRLRDNNVESIVLKVKN